MKLKQRGFTLIELVAVIIILGIMATATTQYIIFGTQIYVESTERQRVLSQSRFFIDRLKRELKTALPYSVRVSASNRCIEFVPITESGVYRTDASATLPPIAPNAESEFIDVITWNGLNNRVGQRFYIYPTNNADVYDVTNDQNDKWGIIDAVSGFLLPEQRVTLRDIDASNKELFPEESPVSRFYTANMSINYCLIQNGTVFDVYRFTENTFSPTQLDPSLPRGVLMAEGLTNNVSTQPPFTFNSASQARNSVVSLYLQFNANQIDNMFFNQEVHIPSVP